MQIGFNTKHIATTLFARRQPGSGDPLKIICETFPNCQAALDDYEPTWTGREVHLESSGSLAVTIILDHDGTSSPLRQQKTVRTKVGFAATLLIEKDSLHCQGREQTTQAIRDRLEAGLQARLREVEGMLAEGHL